MLIDDITIKVKSGDGGDGKVAFNSNMMSLGPVGGDGGKGGDIYCEGVSDLGALGQFRHKKELETDNGGHGRGQFVDGKDGADLVFKVPIGTVINNLDSGEINEVIKVGEKALIARGGSGGKGNFKFRSAVNTSPKEFTRGKPGESFQINLKLKMIADVGLIGLPNVGKSSLLNELTRAKSKVANYHFTTLEPNLGVYYELILADIPGLIEGASEGKGLGIKFLQHIERTRILFHLVSAESEDPAGDYKIVRKELKKYSKELDEKEEYLFVSKHDMVPEDELNKKTDALRKLNSRVFALSVNDEDSVKDVQDILNKIKSDKLMRWRANFMKKIQK